MAHSKCTLPGQSAVAKTSHRYNDVVFRRVKGVPERRSSEPKSCLTSSCFTWAGA